MFKQRIQNADKDSTLAKLKQALNHRVELGEVANFDDALADILKIDINDELIAPYST